MTVPEIIEVPTADYVALQAECVERGKALRRAQEQRDAYRKALQRIAEREPASSSSASVIEYARHVLAGMRPS